MATARSRTYDMVYIGMFVVLMAICSWISIPMVIPVTLQTFAVFLAIVVLGGRRGTLAVMVYLLLGVIGIPVFSGFMGGIGMLLGNTGGYIIGFFFTALIMWGIESLFGRKPWIQAVSMLLGLFVCYAFGTFWFMKVYARNFGAIGITTVLGWCVFPFVIPDVVKMILALLVGRRVSRAIGVH